MILRGLVFYSLTIKSSIDKYNWYTDLCEKVILADSYKCKY